MQLHVFTQQLLLWAQIQNMLIKMQTFQWQIPDGAGKDADRKTWSSLQLMSLIAFSSRSMVAADDAECPSLKPWRLSCLLTPAIINSLLLINRQN